MGYLLVAKDKSWKSIKKDFIEKMVLGNIYITHMVKENKIIVSDEEAKEFYNQKKTQGQLPPYDDQIKEKIKSSLLEQKQQDYVMNTLLPDIKKKFKDSKNITFYDFKDLKKMEERDIEKGKKEKDEDVEKGKKEKDEDVEKK